jgi:hypothetical protein
MRLNSLAYYEYEGGPQSWTLVSLELGPRNLIVGKNASGKTRALNVIASLALQLSGLRPPSVSGSFDCHFTDGTGSYRYEVKFQNNAVHSERVTVGGEVLLDRSPGGEGTIFASEVAGRKMRFQTPTDQFAAVARRDAIQHKFLEPLNLWGTSVRHYLFGSSLGRESVGVIVEEPMSPNERDPNAVIPLFKAGERQFGEPFKEAIIQDMYSVGYDLETVGLCPPITVQIQGQFPGPVVTLFAKERGLTGKTDQLSMSQGMFRCLALFIHLNYARLRGSASCLLIDDIGEGLDFDRSCRLIDTLREKTKDGTVQLVLTTNDRFVMNRVPLEEWSILERSGSVVTVRNYSNSRETFEQFKFAGLSNFTIFEMDVLGTSKKIH